MKQEKTPAQVAEFVESLVATVHKATGCTLDQTPETLPMLDFYCQLCRDQAREKEKKRKGAADGLAGLLAPMMGAYFGEVVRRKYDCRWVAPAGRFGAWRIQFDHCFVYFNPVGVAMEILSRGDDREWPSAFVTTKEDEKLLGASLDIMAPVREDEYYSFIARWEVLDMMVNALTSAAVLARDGLEKLPVYRSADYEKYIKSRSRSR